MRRLQIAIDGPVASGKGSAAKMLAGRLGIVYIDTGAMYRVAAWLAKKNNVDWSDEKRVAKLTEKSKISMRKPVESEDDGRIVTVLVDGEDVSWDIRTEEMSRGSSIVASHAEVRKVLVTKQQQIAESKSVVMEGRDIAARVLPEADLKIYLTASTDVRARRRHKELLSRGVEADFGKVKMEIEARDRRDMKREVDPLQVVAGAWELNTTTLTILETVDLIDKRVKKMGYGK